MSGPKTGDPTDALFDDPTLVDPKPELMPGAAAARAGDSADYNDDDTTGVVQKPPPTPEAPAAEPLPVGRRAPNRWARTQMGGTTAPKVAERSPPMPTPPRAVPRRAPTPRPAPRATEEGDPPAWPRMARFFDVSEGDKRVDRYELLAEIASGGMATVYLGRLKGAGGFQRLVAVKRLHPHLAREEDFIQMFLDEARIAARIHHAHVVPILEIGSSEPDGLYLVMEYVEGVTLLDVAAFAAQSKIAIPRGVALRVVLDTLAGLEAAHGLTDSDGTELHVVHRDVSPSNVLVGVDGSARLTDFGVARAATRLSSTLVGTLKGKVAYMAPEQAKRGNFDHRADLFAMGVILWELLVGKRLFRAETKLETLARVGSMPVPRLSDVVVGMSLALDEACRRSLERDPDARFQSAIEMAEALEKAAGVTIASTRQVAEFIQKMFGKALAERKEAIRSWAEVRGEVLGSIPPLRRSTKPPAGLAAEERLPALAAPKLPSFDEAATLEEPTLDTPFKDLAAPAAERPGEGAIEATVPRRRRPAPSIPDDVPPPNANAAPPPQKSTPGARSVQVSAIIAIEPPPPSRPGDARIRSDSEAEDAVIPASQRLPLPVLPEEKVGLSPEVVASLNAPPPPTPEPEPAPPPDPDPDMQRLDTYAVNEPTLLASRTRPQPAAADEEALAPAGRSTLGYVLVATVAVAVAALLFFLLSRYGR